MTVKECYAALKADYEGTISRFMGNEGLVKKFALKFLKDGNCDLLEKSLAQEDYETAFRAAHTLKGVCMNLGFTKLAEASHDITEALRGGKKPEDDQLMEEVMAEYQRTVETIRTLEES